MKPLAPRGRLRRPSGPLLDVALVHGLLGWLYVAAWAATRPDTLSGPLTSWLPLRRDTFGAVCFALSALAHLTRGLRPQGPPWRAPRGPDGRPGRPRDRLTAVLRTLVGYPLLLWAYLCVNSLTHPQTIDRQLTHFATVPTEGTAAVGCFAASAVALLALRLRAGDPATAAGGDA
ncbi:hypothetical protein [Kitasatospora sp. NBC_01302]|uniref:hypothetical protein n=1 Tax=Kitasatospora sp. NBC_01302 TaxID=2903575 RepID=UPI002E159B27|nr:hypothetical protein OG294_10810 [Kitasatospora sp. NBC_01302]